MDTNLALVLLLSPFIGFLFNVFFGKKIGKTLSGTIGTLTVVVSFAVSIFFFLKVNETHQAIVINLFDWIKFSNFSVKFGFLLDQLSLLWLLFVTGIGSLIHMYSISYMHDDENLHKFFAYLNLFIFFMITLVMGSNLLIMFIGWEGVGLCSYLLIGFWHKNQDYNDAAKKAFIMNRIGDLGLLIGIIIIASLFNTADFIGIHERILEGTNNVTLFWVGIAAFALFIGATGKSAQIPLYTWLPDAMAGPTPVSALIHAATMVTAGIFMITRLNFLFDLAPQVQNIIAIIGAITALVAATIGLLQNDIKKVLAYSTVSQLGLMFLALGLGAYQVAVFHVITHAFFKACLFLGSGSVIHALHGEQDMRKMGGLKKVMPITFITMLISSLAISGIFPFAGFWSKDEILMTAFHENLPLWIIGSVASIMTAFYMFRLYATTFLGKFRGTDEQAHHLHESPFAMTLPLILLALASAIAGAIGIPALMGGHHWLSHQLTPIVGETKEVALSHSIEWALMGASVSIAVIALFIAVNRYKRQADGEPNTALGKFLYNKWYVDELYNNAIVQPLNKFAGFLKETIEKNIIDGAVNGTGKIVQYSARKIRLIQNGQVGYYILFIVLGIILLFLFWFNDITINRFFNNLIK